MNGLLAISSYWPEQRRDGDSKCQVSSQVLLPAVNNKQVMEPQLQFAGGRIKQRQPISACSKVISGLLKQLVL